MHLAQARDARAMDCQKRAAECIESGCPRRYPVRGMQLRSAFFFFAFDVVPTGHAARF